MQSEDYEHVGEAGIFYITVALDYYPGTTKARLKEWKDKLFFKFAPPTIPYSNLDDTGDMREGAVGGKLYPSYAEPGEAGPVVCCVLLSPATGPRESGVICVDDITA